MLGILNTVVTVPFVAFTEFSVTYPVAPYNTSTVSVAAAMAAGLFVD